MFKKGQLVKSSLGNLYVVEGQNLPFINVRSIAHGYFDKIIPIRLKLIGNNYQPKDINKALREVRT